MIRTVLLAFWTFVTLFSFCEFSEIVACQFEIFSEELYQCDWYLATNRLQRMFLVVLANAQQPMDIHGYAGIECTRDTFKKVFIIIRLPKKAR